MADALHARAPGVPWTLRLYAAAPVAPVWIGVATALALFAGFIVPSLALGRLRGFDYAGEPLWLALQTRLEVLQACLIAYLPTAAARARGWRRCWPARRASPPRPPGPSTSRPT